MKVPEAVLDRWLDEVVVVPEEDFRLELEEVTVVELTVVIVVEFVVKEVLTETVGVTNVVDGVDEVV